MSDAGKSAVVSLFPSYAPNRREESETAVQAAEPEQDRHALFLERLYRRHASELCGRLRNMFGSGPPDPEDIAQAAFAKIGEIKDIEAIRHPRAFLFKTAINLGLNAKSRANTAQSFIDDALAEADGTILEQRTPETVFSMRQRLSMIEDVVATLPAKQREVLLRNRVKGETFAEIRAATGWSQGDISRQLNSALASLQDAMRKKDGINKIQSHDNSIRQSRRQHRRHR